MEIRKLNDAGETICPQCKRAYTPELEQRDDFEQRHARWLGGDLIQSVWPDATLNQREQLMTGYCSEACWNAAFEPGDEEDDDG